ncbi:MAG: cob(I)yrinic acid a,c-diamide adenosyltransferase [Planctomycetes bacterium]|nr:cob(I)yrinic acid a,c-diamide adenosyltransferase [Planctomycetota bacterium]
MVFLNRIYTRFGDGGETIMADGSLVPKTDIRLAAFGSVDELNAVLGICLTTDIPEPYRNWIERVQRDLFELGADLCRPSPAEPSRVGPETVQRLEEWIDEANERLEPLSNFILPGGTPAAAHLHHARTVCRRAELAVWQVIEQESRSQQPAVYLNRLSDLLFVLARVCNDEGRKDVPWIPENA